MKRNSSTSNLEDFFPFSISSEEEAMLFNMTPLQKLRIMREPFLRDDMESI